jgi:hydrogenase-4 component B
MQAFRTGNVAYEVIFALAGALIGVAAGVAVVTFTKLVGIGLLGAPRSQHALDAKQTRSPWRLAGLVLGALGIVSGGIFAASLLGMVAPSIDGIAGVSAVEAMIGTFPLVQPAFAGFSSISPAGLGCVILGFTLVFWIIAKCFSRPHGQRVPTWTSGESYRPWTQYTGTGYANPTRVILDASLRTVREIETDRSAGKRRYASAVRPFFDLSFYRSIAQVVLRIGDVVRMTQSGVIAAYLSYILAFTILLLILFPSIRHW